jgi:hypothetical protein
MVIRHLKVWAGLLALALGLLTLKLFAPLSDPLDRILSLVVIAIQLAYVCTYWWEDRRSKAKPDQSSSAAISSSDET